MRKISAAAALFLAGAFLAGLAAGADFNGDGTNDVAVFRPGAGLWSVRDVVKYRFKSEVARDEKAPYHIGFIAEDAPELLTGRDHNSMATGDCIGLLLAAVQEQQKTIAALEGKVARLEERLR